MQNTLLKAWGIEPLHIMETSRNLESSEGSAESSSLGQKKHIIKLPLQFTYLPVEIISKELTKLNSKYKERIIYLGPRWNDSFQWHKKFSNPNNSALEQSESSSFKPGYYFNERRVLRNNSFIHDSMRHNRFFKNQVYYRAFEGMNPTLDEEQIIFQSRFQSGNLDCAVKIRENEYDLFLRIDTNTRGHIFWYYFTVCLHENCKSSSRKVKLNICNITKSKTLYERNLKPYVKRQKLAETSQNPIDNWNQGDGIKNCKFRERRLKYPFIYEKIKPSVLYELSFEIELKPKEKVHLAYCIPYTYSYLMNELSILQKQITAKNIENVAINKLGQSLTGVQIPVITIGDVKDVDNTEDKKVVFITGRAHPGQSNSSFILSSLINQLCLKKGDQVLQNRVIFVIIPMLNPDGVILGNGRCSALGRDLNREFKSWNNFLNPEVIAVKRLVDKIQDYFEIEMYFDFHGHSKKKNIFFFGPNYPLMDPNYYRCRVFPKILAKNLEFFRYYGCSYTISEGKNTTARAVMLNEYNIPFFYTVETSVGFFYDYVKRQDIAFSKHTLFKTGLKFKESLKEYFDGVQEYESFLKGKKKDKSPSKPETPLKQPIVFKLSTQKEPESKQLASQPKLSNLKFMKVFEQIKTQAKNTQKIKKQENSETDSDSCRLSEELQPQKVKQFSQMIITFNKIQQKKIKFQTKGQKYSQTEENQKNNSLRKRKPKQQSSFTEQFNSLIKRFAIKNEPQFRIHSTAKTDFYRSSKSKEISQLTNEIAEQEKQLVLKPESPQAKKKQPRKTVHELNISAYNFFRRSDFSMQIDQSQNLGFVNFSKVIQNQRPQRYSQEGKSYRISSRNQKRRHVNSSFDGEKQKQKLNQNLAKYFFPFDQRHQGVQFDEFSNSNMKNLNGLVPSRPYPASFYRIKYQSSQKKHRNKSPDLPNEMVRRKDEKHLTEPKKKQSSKKIQLFKQPQKLFINISKIQN